MDEFETIGETDQDGWHIEVALAPDYYYQPGYDDDIYPRFEDAQGYDDEDRDYDGRFVRRPIIVDSRSGPLMVTPDEIDRLTEIGGINPRKARKIIESDARAIANESLTWCVIRVRATAPSGVSGTDYLGGVEYDLREANPQANALEVANWHGMADEAMESAARSVLGGYATQALGY